MTDTQADPAPASAPPEHDSQKTVALAIVAVLGLIGLGLIIAGIWTGKWDTLGSGIGAIVGSLATALNAPTGVAKALTAAKTGDNQ